MNLQRRDLLLGAAGAFGGLGLQAVLAGNDDAVAAATESELTDGELATLVSLALVVYPSEVSVDPGFVDAYFWTLPDERVATASTLADALDSHARAAYGARFDALGAGEAATLLGDLGVDAATPNPRGVLAERIRYHLVNGLLYALFTSPRGGELFGIEHPIGHGGGYHGREQVMAER